MDVWRPACVVFILTCCCIVHVTCCKRRGGYQEKTVPVVDTHVHFWDLDKFPYTWPTEDMTTLYKNLLPADYDKQRKKTPIKYSVFVQVLNNRPDEIKWVSEMAKSYPFIKGIVGGLNLTDENFETVLLEAMEDPLFVGCRHILAFEEEDWITRDDVHRGLSLLQKYNKTYDLLLTPNLLKNIPDLAAKFPNLRMVVDHIAKPFIKKGTIDKWKEDMTKIARHPNIYCKISGLVNEADPDNWTINDFRPYVDIIVSMFGTDRVMFGSDWPVSFGSHADLPEIFSLAKDLLSYLSPQDKEKVFSKNAIKFYKLKI